MGANNSRNGREVLPAGIRQRMEELRNRKNGASLQKGELEGTSSHKKRLNDGVDDAKSLSSQENVSVNNKGSPYHVQSTKHVEKSSKVVPLSVSEPRTQEQRNELHDHEKRKDVQKKSEVVDEDEDDDDDEDEDDDDEDDHIQNQRYMCPGSPSFRIYCNEKENKNNQEGHENQTVPMLQKSFSVESANEVVELPAPKRKRSRNKKKKFGAMKKNLLQVKHINMNRMKPMLSCTGSDRRRMYEE